jgi:class 3 adenylate cyclase
VMERLTQFARVITFDRRGSGLSDPFFGAPTLEDQMDDVLAVMEAAGSERAAICGTLEGGPMAAVFAATFPERTDALVLYATFARATWAPDYDWAWPAELRNQHLEEWIARWGEGVVAGSVAPSQMADPAFLEWAGRLERLAASPSTIRRIFELIGEMDVRDVLPSIRVPTLVMHRTQDSFIKVEHSRYIASKVPGARFVELEGGDNMFSVGDSEAVIGEMEEFLTGTRHEREPDRMLATVLFTDICDSTRKAAEMGDRGWRFLLERHDALFRQALDRHRGREVKRTGDGFLATFDGPARAIRCAASVAEAMGSLGLQVRAGLHTGELEVMDGDLGGLAVHIASRVMSAAEPNEVLVSGTVKDLVVGSGIEFEERGEHELRGVPGAWRLYAVN